MRHIHHQDSIDLIGDLPQAPVVDGSGISAVSGEQNQGAFTLEDQLFDLLIIEEAGFGVNIITVCFKKGAGDVVPVTMGQVPAGERSRATRRWACIFWRILFQSAAES